MENTDNIEDAKISVEFIVVPNDGLVHVTCGECHADLLLGKGYDNQELMPSSWYEYKCPNCSSVIFGHTKKFPCTVEEFLSRKEGL